MFSFNETSIEQMALHYVGNKFDEEQVLHSKDTLTCSNEVIKALQRLFLGSVEQAELYHLIIDNTEEKNSVYNCANVIFDTPDQLFNQSIVLADLLFEHSNHPKIKGGEFYTVYLKDCLLNGEVVDGIGLFKTEHKDTFIQIKELSDGFELDSLEGINVDKLDKGCIIFNTEKENGYTLAVVDKTNRGTDARYWFDHFLKVKQREDAYFKTEQVLEMCKEFITEELPNSFETSRVDQMDLMNRSAKYFKEQDSFSLEEFSGDVIGQAEVIDSFKNYTESYQNEHNVQLDDEFEISNTAVQKKSRTFRSVIKLDKNFHIYVHGSREMIEQGVDDQGRKFYTLYYNEEK